LRTLARMSPDKVSALQHKADSFLDSLTYAEPGAW
jgi:hypothetical protein